MISEIATHPVATCIKPVCPSWSILILIFEPGRPALESRTAGPQRADKRSALAYKVQCMLV